MPSNYGADRCGVRPGATVPEIGSVVTPHEEDIHLNLVNHAENVTCPLLAGPSKSPDVLTNLGRLCRPRGKSLWRRVGRTV